MNNEITEELTKRIIEEYGKDEWYAVAQMSYPQLVEHYLSLRRQMRWASEGRLREKEANNKNQYWITVSNDGLEFPSDVYLLTTTRNGAPHYIAEIWEEETANKICKLLNEEKVVEEKEVTHCSYCGNESLSLSEVYADTYSCQDCDEPNPKGYLGGVGTKLVGPNCCKAEIIEVAANPTIYKIQWYNLDGQKTHVLEQIKPHHEDALKNWRNSAHSGIQYKILNPPTGGTGKLVVGGTGENSEQ